MSQPNLVSFVQLEPFIVAWEELGLSDTDLIALEGQVLRAPLAAPVVQGTGGARKLRFAPPSWKRGKSGATRVVYFYFQAGPAIFLLAVYAKSDQEEIRPDQKMQIRQMIATIQKHWKRSRKER
jgi:hypothetical protein